MTWRVRTQVRPVMRADPRGERRDREWAGRQDRLDEDRRRRLGLLVEALRGARNRGSDRVPGD